MTEQYLKEFERWVAGPAANKKRLRAELEEHLRAAESAGDVDALQRLGTPREAAETFSQGRDLEPAGLGRRIGAALVDVGITVALVAGGIGLGSWNASYSSFGGLDVLAIVMVLASAVYWVVVLPVLEWRTGRTPGKAFMGLRTVAESGTSPSFLQVVLRRLTLIFSGPLQLIDWMFVFFNPKHQRGLDVLAKTLVVTDPSEAAAPVGAAANAHP